MAASCSFLNPEVITWIGGCGADLIDVAAATLTSLEKRRRAVNSTGTAGYKLF